MASFRPILSAALLSITPAVWAAPGFIESVRQYTDPAGLDLFVGFETALISANLDLTNSETGEVLEEETISGLGFSSSIGAHYALRNARGTGGVSLLYDGIPASEEDGTIGANITRIMVFGTYDHLIPFTFHPNLRMYAGGGFSAGVGMYSNLHTLRWGFKERGWEDQTRQEFTAIGAVTFDYALNDWLAVEVSPFVEFNLGVGTRQIYGGRIAIRSF